MNEIEIEYKEPGLLWALKWALVMGLAAIGTPILMYLLMKLFGGL